MQIWHFCHKCHKLRLSFGATEESLKSLNIKAGMETGNSSKFVGKKIFNYFHKKNAQNLLKSFQLCQFSTSNFNVVHKLAKFYQLISLKIVQS